MRRALLAGLVAVAGAAGRAAAAPPPAGAPVQLPPPAACLADAALGGCSADPFGSFVNPVRVVAGGDDVYVANQGGKVGHFRRDSATGALTGAAPAAANVGSLPLNDVALAADGARALAAAGDSGGGRLVMFGRAADGALTVLGCADASGAGSCSKLDGIAGARSVAFPPSGPGAYVAAPSGAGAGALVALAWPAMTRCIPAASAAAAGSGCNVGAAAEPALGGARSVVVAPDGKTVYVGGTAGIAGFTRDADGKLGARVACLRRLAAAAGCPLQAGLGTPDDMAFSPDGAFLYLAGGTQITVLARSPATGALSFVECLTAAGGDGCAAVGGLQDPHGIALSPDGRYVAVAGGRADGGEVRTLQRDPQTGRLAPIGCASVGGAGGCTAGAGLQLANGLTAADGGHLYVAAPAAAGGTGALAAFRLETPPVCTGAAVSVPAGTPVAVPLACTDSDGEPITRTVVVPPAHGWLGGIDDAAGRVSFTPVIDYLGPDTLTFMATDGTNESAPATLSITVTPPLDALPHSRIVGLARSVRRRSLRSFHGTATDDHAVRFVQVALLKIEGRARAAVVRRCRTLTLQGGLRLTDPPDGVTCAARPFLPAKGSVRWTFRLRRHLPRGRYVVYSRAVDSAGHAERAFSAARGNRVAFRVR